MKRRKTHTKIVGPSTWNKYSVVYNAPSWACGRGCENGGCEGLIKERRGSAGQKLYSQLIQLLSAMSAPSALALEGSRFPFDHGEQSDERADDSAGPL